MSTTIEYSLTRTEIRGLKTSPKYLSIILLYAAFLAVVILAAWGEFSRPLTISNVVGDAVAFVAIAASFIFLFSVWLFVRAKTSKRSITISPEGISTRIGKVEGETPWRQIKIVSVTEQNVLIARGNGNALFIPNRAFSSPEKKLEFANNVRNWMNAFEPV